MQLVGPLGLGGAGSVLTTSVNKSKWLQRGRGWGGDNITAEGWVGG